MYKANRNEMIIIFLTYLCKNHANKKIRQEYGKSHFDHVENYDDYIKSCPTFLNAINTFDWNEEVAWWFSLSDKWNKIIGQYLSEYYLRHEA